MDGLFEYWPHTRALTKPPLSWIKGYARDERRMRPHWDLKSCIREGYRLATEACNRHHEFWW
jgi:hypothetical protein